MRGIFFDEQAARTVERRLISDGFEVEVKRERFAGEDDDEDHHWVVVSDAPPMVLELLVDFHDGWFDDGILDSTETGATELPTGSPAQLPDGPRRQHRTSPTPARDS
jgi:hypothetical protein